MQGTCPSKSDEFNTPTRVMQEPYLSQSTEFNATMTVTIRIPATTFNKRKLKR